MFIKEIKKLLMIDENKSRNTHTFFSKTAVKLKFE